VKSFHGKAFLGFDAQNSGSDSANGGTYSAELKRNLSSLQIHLTHKLVLTNGHVVFSGKASGGDASVDDSYDDTGADASGKETHNGPLVGEPPAFGTASVYINANTCKYQLFVSFAVPTTVSGTFDSGSHLTVTGSAYSERDHLPNSLSPVGGDSPNAYSGGCPGNPLKKGTSCYRYGTGIVGLCNTSDVSTSKCPARGEPVGNVHFFWTLKPTFFAR
jgi:hypothetical protein